MATPTHAQRFPIGEFTRPEAVTEEHRREWIGAIERLPRDLRAAVDGLTDEQLDTRYRPGGWTLRQVVHHLPESHMNCYVRFKWALTEDEPRIKDYREERWAELADRAAPIGLSLDLLEALHARWVALLQSLGPSEWKRAFVHPESGRKELEVNLGIYAWHGRHHLAHVTTTIEREGWRA